MCRRPVPEVRTAHAKAMLKRHAEGLNEDPRQTRTRVGSGAVNLGEDRLQEADISVIHQVEQQVNEIRRIELLCQQPEDASSESESNSQMSADEVCQQVVPNHDVDLSEPEGNMSEVSDSE